MVVGYLDGAPDAVPVLGTPKGAPQNAAAVVHRGRVAARYAKHHLPNYGVFDEYRYFVPGRSLTVARVHGVDVAIAICEDIWQEGGPVAGAREAGAGLLLVINGSPYERNKDDVRLDLAVRRRAPAPGCTLAYVNMVGGQDELVFDGDSLVVAADGDAAGPGRAVRDRAARGRPGPARTRTPTRGSVRRRTGRAGRAVGRPAAGLGARGGTASPSASSDEAEVYGALVLGLRDYVRKNGFRSVLLGLSGGIDSALIAAIACDAVGRGERLRRLHAEQLLERALAHRRGRPGEAHRPQLPDRADRPDGRRLPGRPAPRRTRRGEPAGAGPRR